MDLAVLRENIKIAFSSIKGQLLRTVLTGLIIAIGIMALVGILTAIDAIQSQISGQFALMGANTFSIQNRGPNIRIGRRGERPKAHPPITYRQARDFKDKFDHHAAITSLSYVASGAAQVEYRNEKTNPNVQVWAADENYLQTGGYEIASGRNITGAEVEKAAPVAIIGQEVKQKLFENSDPLGKVISIGGKKLKVIGLLEEKGSAMGFGGDKTIFVPISKARTIFSRPSETYSINVMALQGDQLNQVTSEAIAVMRGVRRLNPKQENNFHITQSDNLSQSLLENLQYVTIAAVIIGAITMLGAAIALMNIMLVSVTERTREIGVRKAIGAKSVTIRSQFLTEAVIICLMGGFAGAFLGIVIGNAVAALIGGSFIVPWMWIFLSALLCLLTGLISGLYPAIKASRLDPIESLRFE